MKSKWASKMVSKTSPSHVTSDVSIEVCSPVCPSTVSTETDAQATADVRSSPQDLALEGVKAASQLACPTCLSEPDVFQAIMEEIATLQVTSVCHIPHRVRPLLSDVLSSELQQAINCNLWGFVPLSLFVKTVLRTPSRGGKKKRHVISACLLPRLKQWQSGDLVSLWIDARSAAGHRRNVKQSSSMKKKQRALFLAREGRYGDAMQSLRSNGCAPVDDMSAFEELKHRHPYQPSPDWSDDVPPPLFVTSALVLEALKTFPRASSPGFSKLRSQHVIDAIIGNATPSAQDCLESLTRWINFALSGKMDRLISSWLSGAPLTALFKKHDGGSVRPIAVGEVLRRLVSRICCAAVKSKLPDIFLPYGQVGVGIRGGLEAAVHSLSSFFLVMNQLSVASNLTCLMRSITVIVLLF